MKSHPLSSQNALHFLFFQQSIELLERDTLARNYDEGMVKAPWGLSSVNSVRGTTFASTRTPRISFNLSRAEEQPFSTYNICIKSDSR